MRFTLNLNQLQGSWIILLTAVRSGVKLNVNQQETSRGAQL
jgi:hypothetical protein